MRRSRPVLLLCLLEVLTVATAFLPWAGSGESRRSSFRLLRDLAGIGVLDGVAATTVRVAWVLLPAVATVSVLLLVSGRHRGGAALGCVCALLATTGAAAMQFSPLVVLPGARVALGVAAATGATGLVVALRPGTAAVAATATH